jgi:arsenate reductase (thioredoxin)
LPENRVYNVLFLCTGNSARSILGEVLLNELGKGRFRAYSAGSRPKGEVNPMAIETLEAAGLPTAGLRSKSWDEFAAADAPKMDFVFTVCDDAAGETCPIWPGQPLTAHWGIEDPAKVEGTEFQRRAAFEQALRFMRNRITAFINLPLSSIDRMTLTAKLRGIGAMDGATRRAPHVA